MKNFHLKIILCGSLLLTMLTGQAGAEDKLEVKTIPCPYGWEPARFTGVNRRGCYPKDFDYEAANDRYLAKEAMTPQERIAAAQRGWREYKASGASEFMVNLNLFETMTIGGKFIPDHVTIKILKPCHYEYQIIKADLYEPYTPPDNWEVMEVFGVGTAGNSPRHGGSRLFYWLLKREVCE